MADPTYTIISKSILGSSATSVDFTSIPSTYTDLKVVMSYRSDQSATNDAGYCYFNGSSSGYSNVFLYGYGSGYGSVGSNTTGIYLCPLNAATSSANTFSNTEFYIPNYTSSNNKSVSVDGIQEDNNGTAFIALNAGLWSNTAAINRITIYPATGPNFVSGSSFYLYGIKNS